MLLYVGDLHGKTKPLSNIIQSAEARGISTIIQVGDLGVFWPHFPGTPIDKFFQKRARQNKWTVEILTCGGNHDAWPVFYQCWEEQGRPNKVELYPNSGLYFIPRGTILEIEGITHLFLGGAESTDKHLRVEGVDLWEHQEQPSRAEFELFFDQLESGKPNTIVAHELPLRVPVERRLRNQSTTPNMLERALQLSKYQPRRFYAGHHHVLERWKINRTKFYCCGKEGEYWERENEN